MGEGKRDVLEVLKTELIFLKLGGYSLRSAAWAPEFIFEDSPTCINCGREDRIPCTGCVLIQFVPPEHCSEKIACRHIPLNARGETLDSLYRYGNAQEIEDAVGNWLCTTIDRLETERGANAEADDAASGHNAEHDAEDADLAEMRREGPVQKLPSGRAAASQE